jgi:glycine/D-amino acid oxidase-like deaminating enzyme
MQGGMNMQTYTPALSMEQAGSKWTIETSRGKITADQVVIATNAYTSSVLPEFKPLIIPIRGTACSITPPSSHQPGGAKGPFKYTFGFRHGTGEVDYFIPRQGRGRISGNGDTSLIFGGAKGMYLKHLDRWYNNHHDNEIMPGVREYFEGYMSKHFTGWAEGEGTVDHVWSGGEFWS